MPIFETKILTNLSIRFYFITPDKPVLQIGGIHYIWHKQEFF